MERQSLEGGSSQASCLNLSIHTAEGPETIGLVFDSSNTKLEWEEEFTKVLILSKYFFKKILKHIFKLLQDIWSFL